MESCEGPPPRPTGSGDWVEVQKVPPPFEGGAGPGLRSAGTGPASRGRLGLGGFQAAGPGKPGGCGRTERPGLAAPSDPLRAEHSAQAPAPPPAPPTQIPNPVRRARDSMAPTHSYPTCSRLGAPFPFILQPHLGFASRSSPSQSDFFRHPSCKKLCQRLLKASHCSPCAGTSARPHLPLSPSPAGRAAAHPAGTGLHGAEGPGSPRDARTASWKSCTIAPKNKSFLTRVELGKF